METAIINRVADSGLVTLSLEDYYPKEPIMGFDLKSFLFMELILKEKDYRVALKEHDWSQYGGAIVGVHCSVDAIIPMWAYMLAASYLQPVAELVVFATPEQAATSQLVLRINALDPQQFVGQRVVVKGCGELPIGEAAYLAITTKLVPVVKSIMYGEPCSTVPIYKAPKTVSLV